MRCMLKTSRLCKRGAALPRAASLENADAAENDDDALAARLLCMAATIFCPAPIYNLVYRWAIRVSDYLNIVY